MGSHKKNKTMKRNILSTNNSLTLESGSKINNLNIVYHTEGELNIDKTNVIWICHALTANSDVNDWWSDSVGANKIYDSNKYFVICANILGSAYGTTGPLCINPETNEPYYHDFPQITIKDIVMAHQILKNHLQINKIELLVGGSIGGFQAIEWAISEPNVISKLALIATGYKATPWAIAFNESQRMAIRADQTWSENRLDAGKNGLKAARSIALLSYRNYTAYNSTQQGVDDNNLHRAISYQNYQGEKLILRFNAFSYYSLLNSFDSHNISSSEYNIDQALQKIRAKTAIIGVDSDMLFPIVEQQYLAENIKNSSLDIIKSNFGHDGFLIETNQIFPLIKKLLNNE